MMSLLVPLLGGATRRIRALHPASLHLTAHPRPSPRRASPHRRPADVVVPVPQLSPLDGDAAPSASAGASAASCDAAGPGGLSLFHPSDASAVQRLEALGAKRGREAGGQLRKWLRDALRQERLQPAERLKLSANVAPSELRMLAACLAAAPRGCPPPLRFSSRQRAARAVDLPGGSTISNPPPARALPAECALRQQPVISLGHAAAEALGCPAATRWEAASALEHQLLLCLPEGGGMDGSLVPALLDALQQVAQHKVGGRPVVVVCGGGQHLCMGRAGGTMLPCLCVRRPPLLGGGSHPRCLASARAGPPGGGRCAAAAGGVVLPGGRPHTPAPALPLGR
jgi:hypothetical protein